MNDDLKYPCRDIPTNIEEIFIMCELIVYRYRDHETANYYEKEVCESIAACIGEVRKTWRGVPIDQKRKQSE